MRTMRPGPAGGTLALGLALAALTLAPAAAQQTPAPAAGWATPAERGWLDPDTAEAPEAAPPAEAAGARAEQAEPPPEQAGQQPAQVEEPPERAEEVAAVQPEAQPAPEQPVLSEDEIAARVAETYGVDVLRVQRDDLVGGPAYAVRVMAPPGAGGVPFQVTTLVVDAASGELIPQFRHRPSGYQRSGTFMPEPPTDGDGTAMRLRTFRPRPDTAR